VVLTVLAEVLPVRRAPRAVLERADVEAADETVDSAVGSAVVSTVEKEAAAVVQVDTIFELLSLACLLRSCCRFRCRFRYAINSGGT
jgi:hypothetical protein